MSKGHWAKYAPGTGFQYRYSHCLICNHVWRNDKAALIHNGKKPKK